jgi:hypothetical protein
MEREPDLEHDPTPGEDPSVDELNPASQIGRLRTTGGTPESRRVADRGLGTDEEPWGAPPGSRSEDSP